MRVECANKAIRAILTSLRRNGRTYRRSLKFRREKAYTEILNPVVCITNPRKRIFSTKSFPRILNPGLAVARFFFLLSGSNRLADIACFSAAARAFSDDGHTIPGSSYGTRIFGYGDSGDQFETAALLMEEFPSTKRAVLPIYATGDLLRARHSRDVPCANTMTFVPRSGRLDAVVHMRANDALSLLPYNVFEFTLLHECMAARTLMRIGCYYHCAVSMHIRNPRVDQVDRICGERPISEAMPPITRFSAALRLSVVQSADEVRVRAFSGERMEKILTLIRGSEAGRSQLWREMLFVYCLEAFRSQGRMDERNLIGVCGELYPEIQCASLVLRYKKFLTQCRLDS